MKTDSSLLLPELRMGIISYVAARFARVNLRDAGAPSGTYFQAGRYGRGEVGEFVLIEGQQNLVLGRIIEVRLPEGERRDVPQDYFGVADLDAIGAIQLLGSVIVSDGITVTAGIDSYPRLGDRVYAAPHRFIALIPSHMGPGASSNASVRFNLGNVGAAFEGKVEITPEKLFGRHCAILGATGGGKSWTAARILEEALEFQSKIILLDATGEYRSLTHDRIQHCHLGEPPNALEGSVSTGFPPSGFHETDFMSLFRPSPGSQAPKLREAIMSLRMINAKPSLATNGHYEKTGMKYTAHSRNQRDPEVINKIHDPMAEFDPHKLINQIRLECVWPEADSFGRQNDRDWGFCTTLVTRISDIISGRTFGFIFSASDKPSLISELDSFLKSKKKSLLRIDLSGVPFEYDARGIVANAIGRSLLGKARNGYFREKPTVIFVDEAHNFLGKSIAAEESTARLDAFELIAKEGRKFGLNICLATQRPRDITEGVLSQMGTLIVHRLTNDRDREVVERACGEIDKSASAFLPNLKQGEAAVIGVDFPIPLTIQMKPPAHQPLSDGPDYQKYWTKLNTPK